MAPPPSSFREPRKFTLLLTRQIPLILTESIEKERRSYRQEKEKSRFLKPAIKKSPHRRKETPTSKCEGVRLTGITNTSQIFVTIGVVERKGGS